MGRGNTLGNIDVKMGRGNTLGNKDMLRWVVETLLVILMKHKLDFTLSF
jgi:hypothetical protein